MRADDLEQFAVADGLLVRLTAEPGHLSEAEKNYLLFQAARALALVASHERCKGLRTQALM
jgi:hypothetical protein